MEHLMQSTTLSPRRAVCAFLVGTVLFICTALACAIVVDPIGIWGVPPIWGWTNVHSEQEHYYEVFRPYDYARQQPEEVIIGTSRCLFSMCPPSGGYNFAVPVLSFPHMRTYLRYMYAVHTPSRIILCLDPVQFTTDAYEMRGPFAKPNYRLWRLELAAAGRVPRLMGALIDSLMTVPMVPKVIVQSHCSPEQGADFLRGYNARHGEQSAVDPDGYYGAMTTILSQGDFTYPYDERAVACLDEILREAKAHGVEVTAYFPPLSIDELVCYDILGKQQQIDFIKREVAKRMNVYDFAWASRDNIDVKDNYIDLIHTHRRYGDRIAAALRTGDVQGNGWLLTQTTIETALAAEHASYQAWADMHRTHIGQVRNYIESCSPIPVGAFRDTLGF